MSRCRFFAISSLQISSAVEERCHRSDDERTGWFTSPLFDSARPIFSKPILVFTRHGCYFVGSVSSFTLCLLWQVEQTILRIRRINKFK